MKPLIKKYDLTEAEAKKLLQGKGKLSPKDEEKARRLVEAVLMQYLLGQLYERKITRTPARTDTYEPILDTKGKQRFTISKIEDRYLVPDASLLKWYIEHGRATETTESGISPLAELMEEIVKRRRNQLDREERQ